jgi:hypothetical protein
LHAGRADFIFVDYIDDPLPYHWSASAWGKKTTTVTPRLGKSAAHAEAAASGKMIEIRKMNTAKCENLLLFITTSV